ncbi:ABC transporter permease [Micromonospora inositola]|uniref:NitT/TauT family transport system permease protein n=1 Tax=Micromonospora inositola TaxID=47865 RepID=A0A1C5JNP8_9ACTN|nr:ABC transporter permease [Micromonospora inositola]SCG71839.1 NitT/TauT family transport system permease protein [Micromonospora inositola]
MNESTVPTRDRTTGRPDQPVVRYAMDPKAERPPGRLFRLLSSGAGSVVPVVLVLLLWQLGSMAGLIDRTFFPAPSECLQALVRLVSTGELLPNVGITLRRILLGFLLGVIPATLLGIAMGRVPWIRVVIDPLIAITYPIPVVAILPLLLVIFGTGGQPIIVLAGIISFFPAVVNAMSGVLQVDERLVLMARNMGATQRQILWKIVLPGALPAIFAGIRLAAGLALLGTIAGEFLAASDGIGSMTWRYWQIYQIDNMYATLAVIATLGFFLTTVTLRVQRRFFGWTEGQS